MAEFSGRHRIDVWSIVRTVRSNSLTDASSTRARNFGAAKTESAFAIRPTTARHGNGWPKFRLAKATEGYNPFAAENQLVFETMGGSFVIDTGVLSVEDFEIEGPLRVFARADIDTNQSPSTIRSVVGIFLFRKPSALLDNLPLVRSFLPGSERGLFGTYFEVEGPLNDPDVDALPVQSIMSGVPDVIKAPFKALRFLFDGGGDGT